MSSLLLKANQTLICFNNIDKVLRTREVKF